MAHILRDSPLRTGFSASAAHLPMTVTTSLRTKVRTCTSRLSGLTLATAKVKPPTVAGDPLRRPRTALVAALSLAVSACAVIPAYHAPENTTPRHFTAAPLNKTTARTDDNTHGGKAQHLIAGAPPTEWWRQFGSPQLDALVEDGFAHSPTLASTRATLRQTRFLAQAAGAARFPTVGVDASVSRQRSPQQGPLSPTIFNTVAGQLTVGYNPDVFGRSRFTRQSAVAQAQQQRFELQAAYQTLAGNITTSAIQAAHYQAQIDASNRILHDQQRVLDVVEQQYRLGAEPYGNVLTQRSQVASTQANLAALQQSLAVVRHRLAVLTGRYPADLVRHLPRLDALVLPANIPLRLPSTLTRARPDVRAAEAALRATYAQYGLAYAQRFPNFTLSAAFGSSAPNLGDVGSAAFNVWNIALSSTATLFDAGALKYRSEAAKAGFEASLGNYRNTVLQAFEQVANSLRALDNDAQALRARKQALAAASEALGIARDQYRLGSIDFQTLLTREIDASNTRIDYLQALQQRYLDTTALYIALGGRAWPLHEATSSTTAVHD